MKSLPQQEESSVEPGSRKRVLRPLGVGNRFVFRHQCEGVYISTAPCALRI